MRVFAKSLIALSFVLFLLQGGINGNMYDPLWIWLEPKLGLGWGVKGVLAESIIVFGPGIAGAVILWRQMRKRYEFDQ